MAVITRASVCLSLIAIGMLLCLVPTVQAYVEAPHSLGQVITLSTNIMVLRVEKVDKERNLILYRKVRDLKGTHPTDVIRHNIGRGGFNPREWQYPMDWAEVGKTAVFFHNGGASETCIGTYWYQAYAGGDWWSMSHGEPFLLRSFAGNVDKLVAAVTEILAGREVVVPCMVDGNKDDLHLRRARVQRLRASLKLQDYNPKRDFAGWGGEDFRRLAGMPGFTHLATLPRVDPDAQAVSFADIDGDGKPDLCLVGGARTALLQNSGEALSEVALPGATGSRAALWADYNGDGKPDLLLATPSGPKLYTNLGGTFRDDSHLLPKEPCYNLTAAAWIDYDGDGRPDLLLGNGFHGLRLYRNAGRIEGVKPALVLGKWRYIGPFDNDGSRGFDTVYPPEKEIDLARKYPGKNGEEAVWREGKFSDESGNDLLPLFRPENRNWSVVYLHREITTTVGMELPVSLGSDDTLTVWLNGEKLLAQNEYRAAAPDQAQVVLKLKPGKNDVLLKICQGGGEWGFFFQPRKTAPPVVDWRFEDVSEAVGLGPRGIGSDVKGDTLTIVDVNGDGRPDFLYGAGSGLLVLNTPNGFVVSKDSGLAFRPGQVGPVFGDFDNDGYPDLLVPQANGCKLFRNNGKGRFVDVTATSGDLARPFGQVRCAAWGDFDNDGYLDLVVGCLRGPNRFFRNRGDGTFEDATESVGLHQRIFNTQAIGVVDLNGDGVLDLVLNNEGQDSVVLLGNPALAAKRTPLTLQVAGSSGVVGSRVRVLDGAGRLLGTHFLSGGDGRGGQHSPDARFALKPGNYKVEVRYSSGVVRAREFKVSDSPQRGRIDEQTPQAK
jgi:hypothetical protein